MSLTERRKQFLEELRKLYEEYNRPIHYVELAKRLSVSPATAYDIMKVLLKDGYVEAVYLENSIKNKKGRGRVFFKPKEKNIDINIASKIQDFHKYPYSILIILSILFSILKDLKLSKEIKSIIGVFYSIFQSNIELILIFLPLLIMGYAGKKLYEIIPQNKIKIYIEEYIKSLSLLATEERKVLVNLLLNVLEV